MAKLLNFLIFQIGWFACVLGAAHHQDLWAVLATIVYLIIFITRCADPIFELKLITKVLIYGVSTDSLISYLGFMQLGDTWPTPYLSPIWMWALWALFASMLNSSLAWLRNRPILGAVLGGVFGPISYEAGIRLGAGTWGPDSQINGLIAIAIVWAVAMPLFFYWTKKPIKRGL
jgi:hypothetical protein